MASQLFKRGHCDVCDMDKAHLQNLPCLEHRACRSCAAKIACLGPSVPAKELQTCPICVISAANDYEPNAEDMNSPELDGCSSTFPRTNTPAFLPWEHIQSPSHTFANQLATSRLMNISNSPSNENTKRASPSGVAAKNESADSLRSWRSSPRELHQTDITDMGISTLPKADRKHTGAVLATGGILSPRIKDDSPLLLPQSAPLAHVPLDTNVLNPHDTTKVVENPAASYLFFSNNETDKKIDFNYADSLKKKNKRGMAGPITPGAAQKALPKKHPVLTKNKDQVHVEEQKFQKCDGIVPGLLNISANYFISPRTTSGKRKAEGQQIYAPKSRYSNETGLTERRKLLDPELLTLKDARLDSWLSEDNRQNLTNTVKKIDRTSNNEDSEFDVQYNVNNKVRFKEDRKTKYSSGAWSEKRSGTPFPRSPVLSDDDDDEEDAELDRCSSPIKRVRANEQIGRLCHSQDCLSENCTYSNINLDGKAEKRSSLSSVDLLMMALLLPDFI